MEHFPVKLCKMGPLYSDCVSETKTRFLKSSSPSLARVEVICPQPRRAIRVPHFIDDLSRFNSDPMSCSPRNRSKTGFEIIGVLQNKEDVIHECNEVGYLCGSPPVRTHNPVIHDAQFAKKQVNPIITARSSLSSSPSPRLERGSPIYSPAAAAAVGSPKIRVEGFNCKNSDPRCVVPTVA